MAYYLLLALFPALAALVSIYGLLTNPADILKEAQFLSVILPASTVSLIRDELQQFISTSNKSLGLGAIVGVVVAFWSGLNAMTGMMSALDIAYGQREGRSFLRFYATGILLTLVVITGGLISLALVTVLPVFVSGATGRGPAHWFGFIIEWPLLIVFAMCVVALIYSYAPDRNHSMQRFISPEVVVAVSLWVVGSSLFSVYIYHFSSYNRTYGALGALLVLLTWLWLSAFVVLFGAEINSEAEGQTRETIKT